MKHQVEMKLEKPASSKGGDRYKGTLANKDFVVYIPQEITRADGKPCSTLSITVEVS